MKRTAKKKYRGSHVRRLYCDGRQLAPEERERITCSKTPVAPTNANHITPYLCTLFQALNGAIKKAINDKKRLNEEELQCLDDEYPTHSL